jgi:shikimate kinase
MKLSRSEFDRRYAAGELHLAFIGMSNIGKSYTATRLSKTYNFQLVEVDRLIWEELGQGSMADFADWQGQPYTKGYDEREAVSIGLETTATKKAMAPVNANTLLDTTGSVIYVDDAVKADLRENFLIVHIAAGDADLERLKADYFALPKPLVWRGHYRKLDGKSEYESILACYPELLNSRKSAYENIADLSSRQTRQWKAYLPPSETNSIKLFQGRHLSNRGAIVPAQGLRENLNAPHQH